MFKNLGFKIVAMFVLLTISVIIVIGTFMMISTDSFYHKEFTNLMHNVFNPDYVSKLEGLDNAESVFKSVNMYSGQLGIDSFRNFYILDGKNGKALYNTNEELSKTLELSPNILAAMSGRNGDTTNISSNYMDFALNIKCADNLSYIIYIKDSKQESDSIVESIFSIMFQALLLGLVISIIFGILLSKSITSPILSLTQKAQKMASGDFNTHIEVKSKDELGILTNTFNSMASIIHDNLHDIQSEKDRLETILLYMTDGVMAFDSKARLTHINPAARRMLEIDETHYLTFDYIFGDEEISFAQVSFLDHFKSIEYDINRENTKIKAYFATYSTNDNLSGIVVVLQDITEQQKLENERREFVANVSHELRTPITSIKSYTETMMYSISEGESDDKSSMGYLNVINSEADRMTRLIKDLLLLSSLENGKRQLRKEEFDIAALINDVLESLSISAQNKDQILRYEPTNNIPLYKGDRDRIAQVLINILTNAIKYTPKGGLILVSTVFLYNNIYIKIKDNGIGIPQNDIENIFDRFYRVDKARSRDMGGTGLGLAIAKEIVESCGGNIKINSIYKMGTEVVIELPYKNTNN